MKTTTEHEARGGDEKADEERFLLRRGSISVRLRYGLGFSRSGCK